MTPKFQIAFVELERDGIVKRESIEGRTFYRITGIGKLWVERQIIPKIQSLKERGPF